MPAGPGLSGTMSWYAAYGMPRVPIHVAASGPSTIKLAVRHADGVDLTVGADPERLRWGIDLALAASATAGRSATIGAWVNVAVNTDRDVARDLVRGSASIFAHFVSEGPLSVLSTADRSAVEPLRSGYVERHHGLPATRHARRLPDAFLDAFTVTGTPDHVVQRLQDLTALGIQRLILVPGSRDADPAQLLKSNTLLAHEVLPHLA